MQKYSLAIMKEFCKNGFNCRFFLLLFSCSAESNLVYWSWS